MKIVDSNNEQATRVSVSVSVDELAAQLTLIDLKIFKSISKSEILNLGHSTPTPKKSSITLCQNATCDTKKLLLDDKIQNETNKPKLSVTNDTTINNNQQVPLPNVVAMKRQFNQVTFWIMDQILSHQSTRSRAELISHFIRTAKKLHELNNLHSSYAFVSALQSAPIYRLDKTWQLVRKKYLKERQILDVLLAFFSDTNNYETLRLHLRDCQLPCIPYLGLYSRDIIYIKGAFNEGTIQRTNSIRRILETIEKFQTSEYNQLMYLPKLSSLILTGRYIDELQKFNQDQSYRRSLQLEPPQSELTSNHNIKRGVFEVLIHNLISNKYG